jgi:serine acetyltransferase
MSMLQDLRQDARFYHQLCFPDSQPTFLSWIKVLFGSRGLLVIVVHRMSYYYYRRRPTGSVRWVYIPVVHLGCYLSRVIAKCYILHSTQFEPGVYLSNRGHIILGARSVGTGTLIHDRVTIGRNIQNMDIPEIGRNVWIGPNCVISGDITIGDGVTILPNSVLTKSLPPGVMVQGNPARILQRDFDNSKLRRSLCTDVSSLSSKVA